MGYYLEDLRTGERVPATISRLSREEILLVDQSKKFDFEWMREIISEIYGLRILGINEIVGIVAVQCQPKNLAFEIKLIENARSQKGSGKRYDRIAGSLIAFVCKKSFDLGFEGYVYLKPKTAIVDLYRLKYGFVSTGLVMFSDADNSFAILDQYFKDDDTTGPKDD